MTSFTSLATTGEIDDFIADHQLALLFISRKGCSVCQGLKPQVTDMMTHYPKIKLGHIEADQVPEVAGKFDIFTVPVILLYVGGKEYIREARIVHMDLFEEKVDKIYRHVG